MKFVKLTEINDHEGESWHFWLQLDGNEEQLKLLANDIDAFDEYGEFLELNMTPVDESEVDILVKHTNQGYMNYQNKVVGVFTCPKSPESIYDDEESGYEWLTDHFYKGGIQEYFK